MTLRLTESDLAEIQRRRSAWDKPATRPEPKRRKEVRKRREMNKWEAQFAQTLEVRKQAGELIWWAFEPIRIRLADGAFYRPDFVTVDRQGRTEIYEIKGHFREAARVRLRVAAEKLPYPFYLVRESKGQFKVMPV